MKISLRKSAIRSEVQTYSRAFGRFFPPHPSPLPWGEGVTSPIVVPIGRHNFAGPEASAPIQEAPDALSAAKKIPSPWGEGQGEGDSDVLGQQTYSRKRGGVACKSATYSALRTPHPALGGFTMIEIALCLAVIGFALVAIIGVLPIGMSVQKENREDTVINFEANYLMDAIRSGSRGLDSLTNYVVVITNISTLCDSNGTVAGKTYVNWFTTTNAEFNGSPPPGLGSQGVLNNGEMIISLLSLPKYLPATNLTGVAPGSYWSNYVSAVFRSITGSATDQGVSGSSRDFAFDYLVIVENIPSSSFPYFADPTDPLEWANYAAPGQLTNAPVANFTQNGWQTAKNLQASLHELRLRFRWPIILPPDKITGGKLGNGDRVFRTTVGGQMQSFAAISPTNLVPAPPVGYYYLLQPQTFSTPQ